MATKFNMELVSAIRMIQSARERTLTEIRRVYSRDAYTDEFKRSEAGRLVSELKTTANDIFTKITEAAEAQIAAVDAEETRLAGIRAVDFDYLNRLNLKIENMERLLHKNAASDGKIILDDMDRDMINRMKTYFSEFENDPVAVALIHERLGSHGVTVAPSDNTGKRQKHLRVVLYLFNGIIRKASGVIGSHGVSEVQDVDVLVKDEEDAFVGYCMAQDENFSLDDEELIEAACKSHPESRTAYEGILWKIRIEENRKGF